MHSRLKNTREYAANYIERGFAVTPIRHGEKRPVESNWTNQAMAKDEVAQRFTATNTNVGILTGDASGGLVVVDLDHPLALKAADILLPDTSMITGRKSNPRSHRFYKVDNPGKSATFKGSGECGMIVEFLSNGRQAVSPPSIVEDKKSPGHFEEKIFYTDGEPAYVNQDSLREAVKDTAAATLLALEWKRGSRHFQAMAVAGYFLKAGLQPNRVRRLLTAICVCTGDEEQHSDRLACVDTTIQRLNSGLPVVGWSDLVGYFDDESLRCIETWLGTGNPEFNSYLKLAKDRPTSANDNGLAATDFRIALRMTDMYGNRLRWIDASKRWLWWNGVYWEVDKKRIHVQYAKRAIQSYIEDARTVGNKNVPINSLESAKKVNDILELAKAELATEKKDFDSDPDLLTCANGTLDLRTGELRPHCPCDMITRAISIRYNSKAKCPVFNNMLDRIFGVRTELRRFAIRIAGYCLNGSNSEQVFFVFYGTGANGKTTIIKILRHILGPFICEMPIGSMTTKRGPQTNDLARLDGMRVAVVSEMERSHKLAEGLIKQLTGGNSIAAKFHYAEYDEILPECRIIIDTNYHPGIAGMDHGIWRRLRILPFNETIPENERDPDLFSKLIEEAEGIFALMVKAHMAWRRVGLNPPEASMEAVAEYKYDQNPIERYLQDRCIRDSRLQIAKRELHDDYLLWCAMEGEEAEKLIKFGKLIKDIGIKDKKGTNNTAMWSGIGLAHVVNKKKAA